MKYGEMERPIENYGKKEQKEWLDNILPDPHPCAVGNKEEEHIIHTVVCFQTCPNGHKGRMWACQPWLRKHGVYAGSFLPAANILLSGNKCTKVALQFRLMRPRMVSWAQFDHMLSFYAIPAVMEYWEKLRTATIQQLQDRALVLTGIWWHETCGFIHCCIIINWSKQC